MANISFEGLQSNQYSCERIKSSRVVSALRDYVKLRREINPYSGWHAARNPIKDRIEYECLLNEGFYILYQEDGTALAGYLEPGATVYVG